MKQATKINQKTPDDTPSFLGRRLREAISIVVYAIAAFLLLALITYHHSDPGWSSTGMGGSIQNAGGRVGAWFSDFFLYLFGYMAYLFPIMLAYGNWLICRKYALQEAFSSIMVTFRVVGFFLILLAGSGLASLHLPDAPTFLPYKAGGIIGNVIGPGLTQIFNPIGTSLLLTALMLTAITLFAGVSWLAVADSAGRGLLSSLRWMLQLCMHVINKIKDRPEKTAPVISPTSRKIETKPENKPIPTKIISAFREDKKPKKMKKAKKVVTGEMPSISLLDEPDPHKLPGYSNEQLEQMSEDMEMHLRDFGIDAKVVAVHPGPVITRFELQLAPGVKVSKLSGLSKDIARSMSVISVRVVDVIPGKSVVGIEVPNENREIVRFSEVIGSRQYENSHSALSLALGKDIAGNPVIVDVAKMPHLLVAGTTGSGKSVGMNSMILSLLYKATPEDVRLIMVDPKMLELSVYEGIPHLLAPVVTDMKEAANALRWCVAEMERRYRLMASLGVRNLAGFNTKVKQAIEDGEPIEDPFAQVEEGEAKPTLTHLPCIVVLIDEFADMMMVVGKKVEQLIARIAQKARAAGIHLILATQRPSVDVITGLIKANVPTRIAFQVSSRIDSRTVLDQQGAEQLLGHGDMLYLAPGSGVPVRVHGAFVDDHEVHNVVEDWKARGEPDYLEEILDGGSSQESADGGFLAGLDGDESSSSNGEGDPLYDQAVAIVTKTRRASISGIQRRLKIGYNRAARMIEEMETAGVVTPMESNGSREVLTPPPPE